MVLKLILSQLLLQMVALLALILTVQPNLVEQLAIGVHGLQLLVLQLVVNLPVL